MDMANGPADRTAEERKHWQDLRREVLHAHRGEVGGVPDQPDVLEGPGFLYRPQQVLFQTGLDYTAPVVSELSGLSGSPDQALNTAFDEAKLPVHAYLMPPTVNIPELVAELRQQVRGEDRNPIPNIAPNYVFCGEPGSYTGGPDGPPYTAPPFPEGQYATPHTGAPGVAVLDTGYDTSVPALHSGLGWRVTEVGGTDNPLTAGGYFAHEAGHGTFIDGILMRLAPMVPIRQVKVLDPTGVTDDATVALAITQQADVPVLNLSLGGYTQDDMPPVASGQALSRLTDTVVVVAAAGNNGSPEPFWPAAFKSVVAVGALDTSKNQRKRATFSNYGHWVDIYAPGVSVYSTYLKGTWEVPPPNPRSWQINGYATWDGTSFAAPQVAAAIADTMRQSHIGARQAAHVVLGAAPWLAGVGPTYIPSPGVIALSAYPPKPRQTRAAAASPARGSSAAASAATSASAAAGVAPSLTRRCQPSASRALTSSGSGSSGAITALAPTASSAAASPVISSPGPAVDSAESQAASIMVRGALPRRSRSYTVSGPSASSSEENSGLSARKLPCAATCATSAPSSARSAALTVASRAVSTCAPG
jgi:hypothetical protein